MDERFDDVLLNIAGSLGGIEPLFDTIFSFLLRKTDYFHVMQPGDKIGFKAGVAQQLLLRSFAKYEQAASLGAKRAEADAKKKAEAEAKKQAAAEVRRTRWRQGLELPPEPDFHGAIRTGCCQTATQYSR